MTVYYRGSTLSFQATCLDAAGAAVTPSGANLYLVYTSLATGARTRQTVAMTVAANVVSATWDSSVAAADGTIRWSIKAVGANNVVQDGTFDLSANEANPTA